MSTNSVNGKLRTRSIQRFGWVPDLPDARDFMYSAPEAVLTKLPKKVDLRSKMPKVYDQGQLGSCTANAIGAAFEFEQIQQKLKDFMPSRLFIYYNERAMEGTIDSDSGAMIRDGIKSVAKLGVCPETTWPYDIAKFTEKPPRTAYAEAKKHQALVYRRVLANLHQMQGCLASGYPFVFGFTVYESFMSAEVAKTGEVPLPPRSEQLLGGHAVLAVGYDDATPAVHRAQLVGHRLGHEGLLHDALRLPDRSGAGAAISGRSTRWSLLQHQPVARPVRLGERQGRRRRESGRPRARARQAHAAGRPVRGADRERGVRSRAAKSSRRDLRAMPTAGKAAGLLDGLGAGLLPGTPGRKRRVLCIASDPGPTERIAHRTLVGDAGQRVQGFLSKLGLTRSYLCVNAFPYALHPSFGADAPELLAEPAQLAWRNQFYDAVRPGAVDAVIAFGGNAQKAFDLWTHPPAFRSSASRIRAAATRRRSCASGTTRSRRCAKASPLTPTATRAAPITARRSGRPTMPRFPGATCRSACPRSSATTLRAGRDILATTTASPDRVRTTGTR